MCRPYPRLRCRVPILRPEAFNANQPQTLRLDPLSNYTFGTKEQQPEEDTRSMARDVHARSSSSATSTTTLTF